MNNFSVKDKIILVTGSARGIGKFIADSLINAGATVIKVDKNSINDNNKKEWKYDLTDEKCIESLLSMIKENYGRLDVLINNAGITLPTEKKPYPKLSWQKTLDVNLNIPFNLTSKSISLLKKSKSPSVINIASLNASLAFPNNPAYVTSKTALVGLTRSMSLDYGVDGIRFNCVSPGYIKTDMTGESWNNLEKRKARAAKTVLGRWGTPKDIIGIIFLLCSNSSSYITGQNFIIDGGWSIKGL